MFPPKPLDTLPLEVDVQKVLDAFRFFLNSSMSSASDSDVKLKLSVMAGC